MCHCNGYIGPGQVMTNSHAIMVPHPRWKLKRQWVTCRIKRRDERKLQRRVIWDDVRVGREAGRLWIVCTGMISAGSRPYCMQQLSWSWSCVDLSWNPHGFNKSDLLNAMRCWCDHDERNMYFLCLRILFCNSISGHKPNNSLLN